jgi:phosphodiesterase/alkaline phosphatase D-like protein
MNTQHFCIPVTRRTVFSIAIVFASLLASFTSSAEAAVKFLGVAAGDATSTHVTLWTRAIEETVNPSPNIPLKLEITADPAFVNGITPFFNACITDSTKDYVCKVELGGLGPNTVYFYRFVEPAGVVSNIGRIKTAPDASASAPLHFAFSGDNDGLIRPYALASVVPDQQLDFYVNLGDVIYETASNLTLTSGHNGEAWLNSGSVALSGSALNLNSPPTFTGFATAAQLKSDYEKKYRENFLPVNAGGQNSLQALYAAQGNYTTWDNHELGNRQYINGGAPAGGSIGGPAGTDMPSGRGVDARDNGTENPGNINDANTSQTDFMNRSTGFITLRNVFVNSMPITNRPPVNAPTDPRTDGTVQLYFAQSWGKNAILITTDTRSYRDLRIKTANGGADDTGARADVPGRTYLGKTQLGWLKQTLLDAQNAGTPWKFVVISDPIDQLGPIGGALTLLNLPNFGPGGYAPVNADGGKAYQGGYRAERNELLKFIADNHIINVVFLATDDHQNRINELTYSPTSLTGNQASYVKVPYVFSIVAGPLGATGPDLITIHTFAMAQQYANSIFAAQQLAGVEPLGLIGYPGLHDLVRDGDPTAGTNPQAVDFYSPDTFNFTVLDVSADGKTLTVKSIGMDATAQNAGIEYASGPQARQLFSFIIDTAVSDSQASAPPNVTVSRSGFVLDRRTGRFVQQITLKNVGTTPIVGSVAVALDSLSANATLSPSAGVTGATAPGGSPLALVDVGADNVLSPGESVSIVLQFLNPSRAAITYSPRVLAGITP